MLNSALAAILVRTVSTNAPIQTLFQYCRVTTMVVVDLGWVDFDLGYSTILHGQYVATVTDHLPRDFPKYRSTHPRSATTMVTL